MTLTFNRPWPNIRTAQRRIILDICAEYFANPKDSKYIERPRHTDTQTDGRTDSRTDGHCNNRAEQYGSPFHGGRDTSNSNENQCKFQNFTKQKRSCSYDTENYDILFVCFG